MLSYMTENTGFFHFLVGDGISTWVCLHRDSILSARTIHYTQTTQLGQVKFGGSPMM